MKIYTRSGDKGKTSLFSGERVDKDTLRVEAYGTLDELNSVLGLARSWCRDSRVLDVIVATQHALFTAGADLATSSRGRKSPPRIKEESWREQEKRIDEFEQGLPPLKHFILPAGSKGAALLHMARSVCRRGERLVVSVQRQEGDVNPDLLIYLNRLSDLLFVLARAENLTSGGEEVIWKP